MMSELTRFAMLNRHLRTRTRLGTVERYLCSDISIVTSLVNRDGKRRKQLLASRARFVLSQMLFSELAGSRTTVVTRRHSTAKMAQRFYALRVLHNVLGDTPFFLLAMSAYDETSERRDCSL